MSFFEALFSKDIVFLRYAVIAGALSSVLFGVLGSIVTVRRVSSLAGAISHAVLGGIGLALFVGARFGAVWFSPLIGALIFALLSAFIIGIVSLKVKERVDTVINAVWAIGMSLGVLFLAKTPGYADPSSFLFGNILLVSKTDLILLLCLTMVVVFLSWRFYPQILASSFDEEFARIRGVNVNLVFFSILAVVAISVVLLQTFVGIVMVIAMLTLPAGTSSYVCRSLGGMMLASSVLAFLCTELGIFISWNLDLPSGALIVVLTGIVFLSTAAGKFILAKTKK